MKRKAGKDFKNQKWIHKANLHFIVDGNIKETILTEQPYSICRMKKAELERTTHYKLGKLVVISHRSKDKDAAIDKELNK